LRLWTDQHESIQDYDAPVGEADVDRSIPVADQLLAGSTGPEADAIIAEAAATESDPLRTELAEEKDLNLRLAADFENFKRRTRQEAEGHALARKESFIHELLPALDNLERALASGLRARWARLQNARCIGSTRASCNGFTSLSAHQRRRQNALISLD